MTINSEVILFVVLLAFGIWGLVRGPEREIWTVCIILGMVLFLVPGPGIDFIKKLPIHFISGLAALFGNQDGSTSISKQSLPDPWASGILWLAVMGLIYLAYMLGYKCVKNPTAWKDRQIQHHVAGFCMGAVNGIFLCAFLFSQGGKQINFSFQLPDGNLTRNYIAPLIFTGIVLILISFAMSPRKTP